MEGRIFNIQRFSIHDGRGIRTTVFLKGCNLRCVWCHNPESQSAFPELAFYRDKCIGCGKCSEVCKKTFTKECTACGRCAKACQNDAREIIGRTVTTDEVFDVIIRDKEYYITSQGGVTLSGGEPLLQADFAADLLKRCKSENISTALETAGHVPYSQIEKVLPYLDDVLFDIKAIDEKVHINCTGSDNRLILMNAEKLKRSGKNILFRMPVVPGYNIDEVQKVRDFVGDGNLELLAYHAIGAGKYHALSRKYLTEDVVPPDKDKMNALAETVNAIYHPTGF